MAAPPQNALRSQEQSDSGLLGPDRRNVQYTRTFGRPKGMALILHPSLLPPQFERQRGNQKP